MGRPLNDRFFGPDVATPGEVRKQTILGYANFGGTIKECYIVRQRSNRRYEVKETVASTPNALPSQVCISVNKAQEQLLPGEMSISVTPPAPGAATYSRILQSRRVKTLSPAPALLAGVYAWRADEGANIEGPAGTAPPDPQPTPTPTSTPAQSGT